MNTEMKITRAVDRIERQIIHRLRQRGESSDDIEIGVTLIPQDITCSNCDHSHRETMVAIYLGLDCGDARSAVHLQISLTLLATEDAVRTLVDEVWDKMQVNRMGYVSGLPVPQIGRTCEREDD